MVNGECCTLLRYATGDNLDCDLLKEARSVPALVFLLLAIVSEVIGTSALKLSDGFSKPLPSVVVVVGYGLAFWLIAKSLREIPIGTVYAIWSGLGTVGIVLVGVLVFEESLTFPRIAGITLIVAGVVMLNAFGGVN